MHRRHLDYFVAVADELHFGRAATRLFVSQPALTRQIHQLERELGVTLFDRTTRKVELTAAGAAFARHARRALAELDLGARAAARAAPGADAHLAVGFAGSTTYDRMPRVVAEFRRRRPDVTIEIHNEMLTTMQIAALVTGRIDVGLLRPPWADDRVHAISLGSEPMVLAAPDGHRLATTPAVGLDDLRGVPLVCYPVEASTHATIVAACAMADFAPTIAHHAAETHTLLGLVSSGIGVALLPASGCRLPVPGVTYRQLAGDAPRLDLCLAWRRDETSPVVRAFVAAVEELTVDDDPAGTPAAGAVVSASRR